MFSARRAKNKNSRDRRSKLQVPKSAKMPKRRQPDSLKQLCILNIVYSFKRIWWRDYFENFGETQCIYVLGPFDALRKFIFCSLSRGLIRTCIIHVEEINVPPNKYEL